MKRSTPLNDDRWRSLANGGLAVTVAVSSLAAGGWKLEVLPLVAVAAWVTLAACLVCVARSERSARVPGFVGGLIVLAVLTALQAVPLPASWLGWLSPKVYEVRQFVTGDGAGPLSYEPAATWREVAKLLVYAAVGWSAYLLSPRSPDRARVLQPLVVVGLASAAIAIIHRILGLERLFGLIETSAPTSEMLTTFVNPNHAAGFMVLCAATAVGLAAGSTDRSARIGWQVAAGVCAAVSTMLLSKGGWLGLGLALGVYVSVRRFDWARSAKSLALVLTGAVAVTAGAWWLVKDVLLQPAHPWAVAVKLAAVQDVIPLVDDHRSFGIGRGAFVSVYPQYKTSLEQLTFAFPENLLAQLVTEWGVPMGGVAAIGLLVVVFRRLRARPALVLGAMAGVVAVVGQNLVDFSLELAGMAVPVVLVLGAATSTSATWPSGPLDRWPGRAAIMIAFAVGLTSSFGLAFRAGDLDLDANRLERLVKTGASPNASRSLYRDVWHRHPANPLIAAQVAYLHETADPPDYEAAMHAANRALYLAPTYADAHLLSGRLLLRTGFREQGLLSIRRAWQMGASRRALVQHAVSLCQNAEEVWQILPRVDLLTGRPHGRDIAIAARALGAAGRSDVAIALLQRPFDDALASDEELVVLAAVRSTFGLHERALDSIRRYRQQHPDDVEVVVTEANALLRLGRPQEALTAIESIATADDVDLQTLRFNAALAADALDTAADALERLKRQSSAATKVALLETRIAFRRGDLDLALKVLNRALEHDPSHIELRLARAKLFMRRRRYNQAKLDVRLVLRRDPANETAVRLAESLRIPVEPREPLMGTP